ncbi:MAG TPA: SBBP repeat-containing protein, partial [Bryobacteraceae bacterium]
MTFVSQASHFTARGQGYFIGLDSGAATIKTLSPKTGDKEQLLSIEFPGGQKVTAVPGRKLSGVVNYITGNDPHKWQIGLPTVDRVTYPAVYPGIDVVYYGNQQQLEFDLVVKPGADPRAIRMKIRGGGKLSINPDGALRVDDLDGLRISLPKIYQEANGARKNIAGHFSLRGTDEVAFRIDAWDRTRPLIIDPAIVYSRLLTGGLGNSEGSGIAVDPSGNVIVTGDTSAADFPRVNSASANAGGTDGFISKLSSDGASLIYSTVFGGLGTDTPHSLAVDSTGAAWVTGSTNSSDFPLTGSAQVNYGDGFLLKVDNAGVPVFSTFVGYRSTTPYSIAVDPAGNSYVTGSTSVGFPTTPGAIQPSIQGTHAFVSKYSPSGQVLYATLLGGSSQSFNSGQDFGYGIAADSSGDAYITGMTSSPNFVGAPGGGAQTTNQGNNDAFVAKLNADGSALLYFTFLGGSGSEQGNAITVDASLNAYVTGQTNSADLPVSNAAQAAPGGFVDAFVAKLNPSGNAFSYVTLLGGSRRDYGKAIAADPSGNVYVTGSTESPDFPLVSPVQGTIAGNTTSLFSSTDGGATWTPADTRIPGRVFDISMN